MNYDSGVNRKRDIATEGKENKTCHNIWSLTTCPTTLTRPR
jgi:hypothetical protein